MIDNRTARMLDILDSQINLCTRCDLHKGGRAKPFWSTKTKYAILAEAPGKQEVEQGTPLVGPAGKWCMKTLGYLDLSRSNFLLINSVNCRPVDSQGRNGKPTTEQVEKCRYWLRKYIMVVRPEKMIIFGNHALKNMTNEEGIMSLNATSGYSKEFSIPFIRSVHPAMCIYSGTRGQKMLYDSIKAFKELEYDSESDNLWTL